MPLGAHLNRKNIYCKDVNHLSQLDNRVAGISESRTAEFCFSNSFIALFWEDSEERLHTTKYLLPKAGAVPGGGGGACLIREMANKKCK